MPASYRVDACRKLVISKGTGVLTAPELHAHQANLRADPMFQPDYWQLADFTEVTEIQATAEDIRFLANGSQFRAGARRALVVPRPVFFGLARMFEILTEEHGVDLRLFSDLAEASKWLGVDVDSHDYG